jgi:23S rRNA pseudouridine2605 synthase
MSSQRPPQKGNNGPTGPRSSRHSKTGGPSRPGRPGESGSRKGPGSRRPSSTAQSRPKPPTRKPTIAPRAAADRPGELIGPERLQKILAHAGIGSRRACEDLILQGRVTINGQVIRELGTKVDLAKASVSVDGQKVQVERPVYFAVYKPKGYVSTNNDPSGRPRVVDLLPEIPQRVYTVGRLDEMSVGLLLLTNDGELANKLAHPKFGVEKLYRVVVAGSPTREVLNQLTEGIWLAEGKVRAKRVRAIGKRGDSTILELVLAEGKNREVRRMLAKLGHKVMMLTRVAVGPITIKGLTAGQFRPLTGREVDLLRRVADGQSVPMPWMNDRSKPLREPTSRPRRPEGPPRPGGSPGVEHRPGPRNHAGPSQHRHAESHRPSGPMPRNGNGPGFPQHPGMPPSERPGAGRRPSGPRPDGPPQGRRPYDEGPPRHDGPRQFRDHGPRPPGRPGEDRRPGPYRPSGGYGQDRRDQGDGSRRSEGPPRQFRNDGPRPNGPPGSGNGYGQDRRDQGEGARRSEGPPRQFRNDGPRPNGPPGGNGFGSDRRDRREGPPRPDGPRMYREGGPRPPSDRAPRPQQGRPSGGRRSGPPPSQEPRARRTIGMEPGAGINPPEPSGPGRDDRPKPRALRPTGKRPAPRPPGGSRPMPKPRKGGRRPSD